MEFTSGELIVIARTLTRYAKIVSVINGNSDTDETEDIHAVARKAKLIVSTTYGRNVNDIR